MPNLNAIASAYARRINRGTIQKEEIPNEIINRVEDVLEEIKTQEAQENQNDSNL